MVRPTDNRPSNGSSNGAVYFQRARSRECARVPKSDRRDRLKAEVHEQVGKRIDIVAASRAHTDGQKIAELRASIGETTAQLLAERQDIDSIEERSELQQEIIDEILGLGPLEDLMRDPRRRRKSWSTARTRSTWNAGGKITLTDRRFNDERHLRTIIERIIAPARPAHATNPRRWSMRVSQTVRA